MSNKDVQGPRLFADVQTDLFEKSYEEQIAAKSCLPVTCLGITFENDEARRKYFTEKLREKLLDPEFRKIEGFPIGSDEDILSLSDPPYYTACPNPWIADFIAEWEQQKPAKPADYSYHREPFAADVSEGKNDPIYNAHSYHTKVPHKAIMRYILHYTEPGDIVFDGFCGTGMTGVAAQMCGDKNVVMELGYQVKPDGTILQEDTDQDGKTVWVPFSKLGMRRAVLNDLSPAATFIAFNLNSAVEVDILDSTSKSIMAASNNEVGHLYRLDQHSGTGEEIYHMIWSEVLMCGSCSREFAFWTGGVDKKTKAIKDEVECPHCGSKQKKRDLNRAQEKLYNPNRNTVEQVAKYVPVAVETISNRVERELTSSEAKAAHALEEMRVASWFPSVSLEQDIDLWYERDYRSLGLFTVDRFYTRRNLAVLADIWQRVSQVVDVRTRNALRFALTGMVVNLSRMNRWRPDVSFPYNPLSGTLYIPSLSVESNVYVGVANKVKRLVKLWRNMSLTTAPLISTQSVTSLNHIPSNSLDYVFIDPPFGSNIIYSDLSILHEAWLKVATSTHHEAVVHRRKKKDATTLDKYRKLILESLREVHRCLKPGRWVTIEFSNTRATVWNAIQTSLQDAGFVVANVSALDKQQGSFKAVTTPTAVKQDLVISAYKPNGGFEERFIKEADTEEGVWDFVRTHLKYLPVFKRQGNVLQPITERDPRILFDQMVAYYVRKGYPVPISSPEFQLGLAQLFIERDGLYFLPEQSAEYDRQKMTSTTPIQGTFTGFVDDEASAIDWLRFLLKEKPQTFQDIHPQFIKAIGGWKKTEKSLELKELLEDNFYCFEGNGEVPSQIHSYLSTNWQEFRNLSKDNPGLMAKAKDRWCVPDPKDAAQIEQMREKRLLREFEHYKTETKKLKVFRLEAVRTGFKSLWQQKTDDAYRTIVEVAEKIPNNVLEEDPKLLMWYDQAVTRIGGK